MRLLQITAYSLTALAAINLTAQAGEKPETDSVAANQITSAQIQATGELLSQKLGTRFYLQNNHSSRFEQAELSPQEEAQLKSEVVVDNQFSSGQIQVAGELISQELGTEFYKKSNYNPPLEITELSPQTSTQAEDLQAEELNLELTPNNQKVIAESVEEDNLTCAYNHSASFVAEENAEPQQVEIAQISSVNCPSPQPINLIELPEAEEGFAASPSLSIYIPVGYGADNNTIFTSQTYQPDVRVDEGGVYTGGVGVGIGDADELVGLEVSYAFETNDDFGDGGFNAKVHRRFADDFSLAAGWNGFLNIGRNDFEQSIYGVATKVFRTRPSLNDTLSRVAVSVGIGNNQFRSEGDFNNGENGVNVFGNIAVRVIRPVSFITEWTGQDLALGLSIAPFKDIPFVITPAVRDVAGIGDGARFVLGWGAAWQFK